MAVPAITVLLWHASQDFTIERITRRKFWRKSTVKIGQYVGNRDHSVHFTLEKRRSASTKLCISIYRESFFFLSLLFFENYTSLGNGFPSILKRDEERKGNAVERICWISYVTTIDLNIPKAFSFNLNSIVKENFNWEKSTWYALLGQLLINKWSKAERNAG